LADDVATHRQRIDIRAPRLADRVDQCLCFPDAFGPLVVFRTVLIMSDPVDRCRGSEDKRFVP
jgi:hypothetical protein